MKKILIVEDDLDIQEMIQFFLEDQNYQVCVADDGVEGVAIFNKEHPDMVLLDIMLPKMDGLPFVKSSGKVQMCQLL